jgi:hypothetical protein
MIVIPGGAIDLDGTGADNYVATFTGPTTIGGEANLTFDGTDLVIASGSLQVRTIDYSDGDNAMTIADGGAVTFAQNTFHANGMGVVIGDTAQRTIGGAVPEIQIAGTGGSDTALSIGRWSNDSSGPSLRFISSRATSIGTLHADSRLDTAGDIVGNIVFAADDGSTDTEGNAYGHYAATISAQLDLATSASNDMPGRLVFSTTADGANSVTERMRIDSSGRVGIGETAPANLLHVKVSDVGVNPHASAQIVLERDGTNYLQFLTATDGTSGLLFGDALDIDVGKIYYDHNVPAMYLTVETANILTLKSSEVIFNDGHANTDFRIEGDANSNMFVIDAAEDVAAIGSAVNANYLLTIGGAHTGGSNSFGVRVEPTITGVAGNNASIVNIAGTLTRAGSGSVHPNFWGTSFSAPTVDGTVNVTDTATVIIHGAMTAGTGENYALFVDTGPSRFDGIVLIGQGTDTGFATGADNLIVGDGSNHEGMTIFTGNNSIGSISFADAADPDGYSGYIQYGHGTQGEKLHFGAGGGLEMTLTSAGILFLGGETANANMTTGLTINQGTATDWAFTLKGSNVDTNTGGAIPAATNVEDDDYFAISKLNGTEGGAQINVMNDNHANTRAFVIGVSGGQAEDDQTNNSGLGLMDIYVTQHNGSGSAGTVTDGGNVLSVRCNSGGSALTRFIVTEDGELFATNSTVAALSDTYDDAQLVRALDHAKDANGAKGIVKDKWDSFVKYNEQDLVDIGVLGETVDKGGMLSVTALQRLHNGAIWQGYTRQMEQQERIKELETRLLALEGGA